MADTLPPVVARLVADTGSFVRDMAEARAAAEAAMRGIRDASARDLPRFSGDLRDVERELPRFSGNLHDAGTQLPRFSGELGDTGKAMRGLATEAEQSSTSTRTSFDRLAAGVERDTKRATAASNHMAMRTKAILGGIALAAPVAGAALTVGLGSAFIGLAVIAQHNNQQVQDSFNALKTDVVSKTKAMTAGMVGPISDAAGQMQSTFDSLAPALDSIFTNVTPDIAILTNGIDRLATNAMPGLVNATHVSQGAFRGFSNFLGATGSGISDLFTSLSGDASQFEQDFTTLGQVVHNVLNVTGNFVAFVGSVGAGALPVFNGVLGATVDVLDGLMAVLGPISSQLGMLGASAGTAVLGFKAFQAVQGWVSSAGEGLVNLGARVENLSPRIGGAIGKFGILASTMAGPVGLAVGALSIGLGLLGMSQRKAAEAAAAHTRAVDTLASALAKSNGVVDANVRKTQAQSLQQDSNAKTLMATGVSLRTLTNATLNQNDSVGAHITKLKQQRSALENSIKGHYRYVDSAHGMQKVLDGTGRKMQNQIHDISGQINAWKGLEGTYGDAVKKNKQLANAINGTGAAATIASSNASQLTSALKTLGDATASSDQKVKALQLDLKLLSEGGMQAANDYAGKFELNLKGLVSSLKNMQGGALSANEVLKQTSARGAQVAQKIESARNAMAGYAQKAHDAGRSTQATTQHLQGMYNELVNSLTPAFGGNRQAVIDLLRSMQLIPKRIATEVSQPGMAKAQTEADILRNKVLAVPNSHTIETTALTKTSLDRLHTLGFTTRRLPDGNFLVTAATAGALNGVLGVLSAENALYDKNITISTYHRDFHTAIYRSRYLHSIGSRGYGIAGGGILKPFAGGGFYDGHPLTPMRGGLAQMVPPRTFRVVGDNMRVPEAYIPIDPGSQRSQELLSRTNKLMGRMTVAATKGGSPVAATPSVPRASTPTGGTSPHLTVIVQGSVVTERRLIDVVQQGMLEVGARRPQSYQQGRR